MMDFIFTAKYKALFVILLGVGVFGYCKYFKRTHIPSIYAFLFGLFFVAIGWAAVGSFFSIKTMLDTLLLQSDIPSMIEKMFLLGYSFILLGLMSFADEILDKVTQTKKKKA